MSSSVSSPPLRRHAARYWLPVVIWVGVMLYFSSSPKPYAAIGGEGTTTLDVVGHVLGFVVLMPLVVRWLAARQGGYGKRTLVYGVVVCLAYALFDEVHQIPIPGRSFEALDLLTDSAGVAVGVALTLAWLRRHSGSTGPRPSRAP